MDTKKLGHTDIDIPVIGMGTWNVAPPDEYAPAVVDDDKVIEALIFGIERGLTHIDTAEMYGDGHAEQLIGQAIKHIDRTALFIATKVEPEHYHYSSVLRAAIGSLKRLGTDYIDLYQIHWPPRNVPIAETMRAMEELVDEKVVRFIGVSNFSVGQLEQAQKALTRYRIVSNQVKYNVFERGIESDLLPFAEREHITITAYSPFATGGLFEYSGEGIDVVAHLAGKYHRTAAQIYLNWLIARKQVITIPKAVQISHLEENAGASEWRMETEDYELVGRAFSTEVARRF